MRQLSLFDYYPEDPEAYPEEPEIGTWLPRAGAAISHIMRPSYIGHKVAMNKSTQSMTIYKVGILEEYFECRGVMRSVVFDGGKQRNFIDHYPGCEIYEVLPWDQYQKRNEAIGRKGRK